MRVYVLHHSCNSSMRAQSCVQALSGVYLKGFSSVSHQQHLSRSWGSSRSAGSPGGEEKQRKKIPVHKLPLSAIRSKLHGAGNVCLVSQ